MWNQGNFSADHGFNCTCSQFQGTELLGQEPVRPLARSLATPQPRPSMIPLSRRVLGRQAGVGQFRERHLGKAEGPGGLQKKPVKRTAPATSVSCLVIFDVVTKRYSCPLPSLMSKIIVFPLFRHKASLGNQSAPGSQSSLRVGAPPQATKGQDVVPRIGAERQQETSLVCLTSTTAQLSRYVTRWV